MEVVGENIDDSRYYEKEVRVIPYLTVVCSPADFVKLYGVINQRIHQPNIHDAEVKDLELIITLDIDVFDEHADGHDINRMHNESKQMVVSSIFFPFEMDQLLHSIGREDLQLLRFTQNLGQLGTLRVHHGKKVDDILDLSPRSFFLEVFVLDV